MTTSTDWDPDLYARFEALRSRPFWDLAELIDTSTPIERLVDLGCGTGELTIQLADHLGAGEAVGVDTSSTMLQRAAAHAATHVPNSVRFEHGDIATWTARDVDLVVANASMHWVPDHAGVLARWCGALAPGGQLIVQVPANADHRSHTCSVAVANREPFRSAMGGTPPPDPVAANVLAWHASNRPRRLKLLPGRAQIGRRC